MNKKIASIGEQIQNDLQCLLQDSEVDDSMMDKACQIVVDNMNTYCIDLKPSQSQDSSEEITAYDHQLLNALGDPRERKTLYQLSMRVDYDDTVLLNRIEKLIRLGYCKEYKTQSAKRYGRI